jgi:hypothetical protein
MYMVERVIARIFFCEKEHHRMWIKNDLRAPVEDTTIVASHSSPPMDARGIGRQGDKPPSPIRKMFSLLFGMCKSQHVTDANAQHERRARRKDTKSIKEIHSHLNLQPPRSPISFEGEESPEIETFEERVAHFDVETLVQQWYGDASFSCFGFDFGGTVGASSSHPPPIDSPPLAIPQNDEEGEESKEEDDDE